MPDDDKTVEVYPLGAFTRDYCREDTDIYDVMDKLDEVIGAYDDLRIKVESLISKVNGKER